MTPVQFDERMGWRKLDEPVTEVPGWTTHWWINRVDPRVRRTYGVFAVSHKRYPGGKGRRFVTIYISFEFVADRAVDTGEWLAMRFDKDVEDNL